VILKRHYPNPGWHAHQSGVSFRRCGRRKRRADAAWLPDRDSRNYFKMPNMLLARRSSASSTPSLSVSAAGRAAAIQWRRAGLSTRSSAEIRAGSPPSVRRQHARFPRRRWQTASGCILVAMVRPNRSQRLLQPLLGAVGPSHRCLHGATSTGWSAPSMSGALFCFPVQNTTLAGRKGRGKSRDQTRRPLRPARLERHCSRSGRAAPSIRPTSFMPNAPSTT